jgi:hypothetical protein
MKACLEQAGIRLKSGFQNDGGHDYRQTKTYPVKYAKLRCKLCGDEKPMTSK